MTTQDVDTSRGTPKPPTPLHLSLALFGTLFIANTIHSGDILASLDAMVETMFSPGLLAFLLQMVFILCAGYSLASTRQIRFILTRFSDLFETPPALGSGIVVITSLASLFNWGLGLILGAMLAQKAIRKFNAAPIQNPEELAAFFACSGYTALAIWHGGLSGSALLQTASERSFLGTTISVQDTIFSLQNILTCIALIIAYAFSAYMIGRYLMKPLQGDNSALATDAAIAHSEDTSGKSTEILAWLLATFWGLPFLHSLISPAAHFGLNEAISLFMMLSVMLHGQIETALKHLKEGVAASVDILVQFPIYFAVLALAKPFVSMGADALSQTDAPHIATFVSASIVNLLIPSGGGQWALQAPLIKEMAYTLPNTTEQLPSLVLSFAYGDQLTNWIQPFWALPVLALTGVNPWKMLKWGTVFFVVGLATTVTCLSIAC